MSFPVDVMNDVKETPCKSLARCPFFILLVLSASLLKRLISLYKLQRFSQIRTEHFHSITTSGLHECHWAFFSFSSDHPPFLCKLFDQFDSVKQNMAPCVFQANFPLHRWLISVYFSFIFNGRPFRHWTHCFLHTLVCRCTPPPHWLFAQWWG